MNRSVLFVVAAVVSLVVGFLLTVGALSGGNPTAWGFAGAAFLSASLIP